MTTMRRYYDPNGIKTISEAVTLRETEADHLAMRRATYERMQRDRRDFEVRAGNLAVIAQELAELAAQVTEAEGFDWGAAERQLGFTEVALDGLARQLAAAAGVVVACAANAAR